MQLLQEVCTSFADILRPLAKLTGHEVKWDWCTKCDLSFQMMKDFLISAPILKYPDTSKPYTIFTDASKYGWLVFSPKSIHL